MLNYLCALNTALNDLTENFRHRKYSEQPGYTRMGRVAHINLLITFKFNAQI